MSELPDLQTGKCWGQVRWGLSVPWVSVREDEGAWLMEGGGGRRAKSMYPMPLNGTLENG